MLSPNEFTVGKVGSAKPLSLIIPTNKYEETILVGQIDKVAVAVFLSGQFKSCFFESEENESWSGIIIPDVRIEVDETSPMDTNRTDKSLLSVIRIDTRLVIAARSERLSGRSVFITLHDNLVSAGEFQAAFPNWRIVVGEGQEKRIVWSTMNDGTS